jgi:hypothetical protein
MEDRDCCVNDLQVDVVEGSVGLDVDSEKATAILLKDAGLSL